MLDNVVISGEDVCCSVVCDTLVSVFVYSVMWSEMLMTSAICCALWSSVYECHTVECAFTFPVMTSPVWYVRDVMYAVLYVCARCFVVCGCPVSRRNIDVCNSDMFSVDNVYHDHLKFCVVCIIICCGMCARRARLCVWLGLTNILFIDESMAVQISPSPPLSSVPPTEQISYDSTFDVLQLNANGMENKLTELGVVL